MATMASFDFIIYESLNKDRVLRFLKALLQDLENNLDILKNGQRFVAALLNEAEKRRLCGDILTEYVFLLLLESENPFSLQCENHSPINSTLKQLVLRDLQIVTSLCETDLSPLEQQLQLGFSLKNYAPELVQKKRAQPFAQELYQALCSFYQKYGCGLLPRFTMLRACMNKDTLSLEGCCNSDTVTPDDLIGYTAQKKALMDNTSAFAQGLPAEHVLLAGARGTGKSSCVKAVANVFFEQGIRLVELPQAQLSMLSRLCGLLSQRGMKFIVFIDDLSFQENDLQYKALKSVLEGGAELAPNLRFYVTSNRRHLVQEKFSDRHEEIHEGDTMNEKISLSDRFGLSLYFSPPDQTLYMEIVEGIAKRNHLTLTEDQKARAIQWELLRNGRSGRSAKQFVDTLKREGNLT